MSTPPITPPGPALQQARASIASGQSRLAQAGLSLRAPPPEPDSCCGRGCHGCVWEGYYAALGFWLEDAEALLAGAAPA